MPKVKANQIKFSKKREFSSYHPPSAAKRKETNVRHSSEDWEPHKSLILRLYYKENRSLQDVVRIVREKNGFRASEPQYKHKLKSWRKLQNEGTDNPQEERLSSSPIVQFDKRKQKGKSAVAPQALGEGDQEVQQLAPLGQFARYSPPEQLTLRLSPGFMDVDNMTNDNWAPMRLGPCTPNLNTTSVTSIAGNVNNTTTEIEFPPIHSNDPDRGSSVDFSMDLLAEDSEGGLYNDDDHLIPFQSDLDPADPDSIEDIIRHSNTDSDIHDSVLDISDMLDVELLTNGKSGFILQVDLPFFVFQSLMASQDIFSRFSLNMRNNHPINTDLLPHQSHLVASSRALQSDSLLNGDGTEKLEGIMEVWYREPPFFMNNLDHTITSMIPQRWSNSFHEAVERRGFFQSRADVRFRELFGVIAFYGSNNLLEGYQMTNAMQWISEQGLKAAFITFLRMNTATTRAFAHNIVDMVVDIGDIELFDSLSIPQEQLPRLLFRAIEFGILRMVRYLIPKCEPDILKGSKGGELLCKIAGMDENVEIGKILLERGANVDHCGGWREISPLQLASVEDAVSMVALLVSYNANVHLWTRECGWRLCDDLLDLDLEQRIGIAGVGTPLWWVLALRREHGATITRLLLNAGAHIPGSFDESNLIDRLLDYNDHSIYDVLSEVAKSRSIIDYTIAEIIQMTKLGTAAFSKFLSNACPQVPDFLLERALYRLLQAAVNQEDIAPISTLLACGVNTNAPSLKPNLFTLDAALQNCKVKGDQVATTILQLLLDSGLCLRQKELLSTVRHFRDSYEIFHSFLLPNINIQLLGPEILEDVIYSADPQVNFKVIELLLDSGVPINAPGSNYYPIQVAAYRKNLDLCQYLISRGANVNSPPHTCEGFTALQEACIAYLGWDNDSVKLVKFLLEKGANVNVPPVSPGGRTALQAAAQNLKGIPSSSRPGLIEIIGLLIDSSTVLCAEAGVDREIPICMLAYMGETGLLRKALCKMNELASTYSGDLFVTKLNNSYEWGHTAVGLAALFSNLDSIKLLIHHGADINLPCCLGNGFTPVQVTIDDDQNHQGFHVTKYLLDQGAKFQLSSSYESTPVEWGLLLKVVKGGSIPFVKMLLEHGLGPNAGLPHAFLLKAITAAAENGRIDMVQWLLNYPVADPEARPITDFQEAIEKARKYPEIQRILENSQVHRRAAMHWD